MKSNRKIKDARVSISLKAEYYSAFNEIDHDDKFSNWIKGKYVENVRFSIRRTLSKRNIFRRILVIVSVLMVSEIIFAITLIHLQAKLLLLSPLLNIGLYYFIGRGLIKNISTQHAYDRFLIKHFNEFDSEVLIYKTLNDILCSKDYTFDDKMIAKVILGKFDPKDIRI